MAHSNPVKLVWYDTTIFESEENQKLFKTFDETFDNCVGFVNESECKRFIGRDGVGVKRIILIVSGALGKDLVPQIHQHSNICSIFVYCGNKTLHQKWAAKYEPKVKYNFTIFSRCLHIVST